MSGRTILATEETYARFLKAKVLTSLVTAHLVWDHASCKPWIESLPPPDSEPYNYHSDAVSQSNGAANCIVQVVPTANTLVRCRYILFTVAEAREWLFISSLSR